MDARKYTHTVFLLFLIHICETLGFDYDYVTCGSAVKLVNKAYGIRLHSHDVKYGSGSGQQSVTGMQDQLDANSYWQVRAAMKKFCKRGSPIKCGQTIRLTHLSTQKNLHTHHFSAPMTQEQEVSAFGEEGEGDNLDNWIVLCDNDYWSRNDHIRLKHKETENYLSCTSKTYGRPINGQNEIVALGAPTKASNYWKAVEGVFIKPSEAMDKE
ncbi:stromal cell-derived factor 2-like [Styela clava]|uniref:stromal cell-derived factor 2-like n=1 Tax=Styela clava TaxID=7725 RepID=UPI00193A54F7|nr:stromal cell-derived factor 2-like [Styela clava]